MPRPPDAQGKRGTGLPHSTAIQKTSREAYGQIGQLLAELRESLAGTDQVHLAEQQAQQLKKENPTLRLLVTELRREGFVKK